MVSRWFDTALLPVMMRLVTSPLECMGMASQEGDLDLMIKKRNGAHMAEDEIMMKFVQICLGLLHVHSKVCPFVVGCIASYVGWMVPDYVASLCRAVPYLLWAALPDALLH